MNFWHPKRQKQAAFGFLIFDPIRGPDQTGPWLVLLPLFWIKSLKTVERCRSVPLIVTGPALGEGETDYTALGGTPQHLRGPHPPLRGQYLRGWSAAAP